MGASKDADKPSVKTRTLPEGLQPARLEGMDGVTAIHVVGTSQQFELPRGLKSIRVGSGEDCDIVLASPYLSRSHFTLERRPSGMRVYDNDSRNGLVYRAREERVFDLRPGETFLAPPLTFLALNDEMRAAFPVLSEIAGDEDEPRLAQTGTHSPGQLIQLATLGSHLLILGEPGCDQDRLAHALHAISLARLRPLVELGPVVDSDRAKQRELIDRASRSTLLIALADDSRVLDGTFVSMIFSRSYQIRVIAIAPFEDKAKAVLGAEHVRGMSQIALRPLRARAGAIPRLLDARFAAIGSPVRTSDLTHANQAALCAWAWAENLGELRAVADQIAAVVREGSLRKAAEALGQPFSTIQRRFSNIGLEPKPLLANEARA